MLSVYGKLSDKSFHRRLNTIPSPEDAIANDVLYHNLCWASAKKKSVPCVEIEENFSKIFSEIELINFVEASLNDPAKTVLDMNIVNKAYKDILIGNGENAETLADDYKKHLKELIQGYIPSAIFVKNSQKNKPEQIISEDAQSDVVHAFVDNRSNSEDLQTMWKIAKSIRKEMLQQHWKFEGDLKSFKPPSIMSTFLKGVLVGALTLIYLIILQHMNFQSS